VFQFTTLTAQLISKIVCNIDQLPRYTTHTYGIAHGFFNFQWAIHCGAPKRVLAMAPFSQGWPPLNH